ncbi:MAG TPA: Gfo/Idh/MocA family oxidoreductase [Thermodesulfovibrionales bacterium]|nr:Gfo/Idh/MocA family oxidoreductase [Thermodesulfovibrionales bacterium]
MPLRVAVVGAGYLGQHHARIYSELDGAELAGVVDCDVARANEVAARCGARAYTDYREVLGEVDAVSIVVPTTNHFEVALDCVRAGKDVFVEKPIAATVLEADELIHEAKKADRVLQVGHLERYNPGISVLSQMIDRPMLIETVRLSPFLNRGCDVDVTLDLMIHDIDIILSIISEPVKRIGAFGLSLVTNKIDEARAWIEFENGALACLTASRVAREKQRRLKVFQKDAVIELDYQTGAVERYLPADPLKREVSRPEYREPLKEELRDFVQCSVRRERPRVSGVEGRNALRLALEIGSLARCGR